jgi:hypothetical protein
MTPKPPAAAEQAFRQALEAQRAGRHPEAVQLLAQAGSQDHGPALSMLGGQLMSGRGVAPDFASGLAMMRRAAELDDAYALAVLAAAACYGLENPPDWNAGLDLLQRSAELGYASSQAQLAILADPQASAPATTDWAGLRARIDLHAWRSPPEPQILRADPEIRTVAGLAPRSVCDWLIRRVRGRLRRAVVHDLVTTRQAPGDQRTNSAAAFHLIHADLVALMLQARLVAAAGMDLSALENPQVFHYAAGQWFAPHFDFLEPEAPGTAASIARYGQRAATLLVYLNEGFEGGETDFPDLGLSYKGGAGDALMFRNLGPSGAPDRRTLHAGLPPTSGEKWLFSQWVRDRPQGSA